MDMSISYFKAQAVGEWTKDFILEYLKRDPFQTRTSMYPIPLSHPMNGTLKVISEFADEIIGDSRFAIETRNYIIFISRVRTNVNEPYMYFPTKVLSFNQLKQMQKKSN
jgi:hypothetical protein